MKKNLIYIAPSVEFVDYINEGVLCQSGLLEDFNEVDLVDIEIPAPVAL